MNPDKFYSRLEEGYMLEFVEDCDEYSVENKASFVIDKLPER